MILIYLAICLINLVKKNLVEKESRKFDKPSDGISEKIIEPTNNDAETEENIPEQIILLKMVFKTPRTSNRAFPRSKK